MATLGLAWRLLESLRAPVMLESRSLGVSASIGIALYPRDGGDYDELLRKSDMAMYRAKLDGRDNAMLHARIIAGDRLAVTTTSP